MPRNITVTFDDGSTHIYQNAPDDVTPDAVSARAQKEFGKTVTALDGGRGAAPAAAPGQIPVDTRYTAPPAQPSEIPLGRRVMQFVRPTVEALGAVGGGALGTVAATPGLGTVAGAGLGYGAAKTGMDIVEQALGYQRAPSSAGEALATGAKDVLTGAAMEAGGRAAVPALNWLAQKGAAAAGKVMDIRQLPNQLAAKTARDALGSPEQVSAARAALQAAESQGLTAQQALAREGVVSPSAQATIERAIKRTGAVDTRAAIETAQEAARKSTIKGITPDLDAAVSARRAASQPLYEAADKAIVPIDAELSNVLTRMPEGTLAAAANIAKMEGRPFIMGKTTVPQLVESGVLDSAGRPIMREAPGQTAEITGESLHYIKRALSDLAYGPTAATGAGRDTQLAARRLLDDYVKVFETKVPEYGQARKVFSDLSAPVNQAQVLREMVSVLEKPGGGERLGPFLNVLGRGETAMLKRAAGRGGPRFESLAEVLTPEQIGKVREVAKQLETEAASSAQISAGQQRVTDLLKDELPNFRIPNIFNVFVTTANKVLDSLGMKVGAKTIQKLADASLSAKTFDELLATLPGQERSKVLKAISDPSTWAALKPVKPVLGASAIGVTGAFTTPANALAPESENVNALAQ